MKLLLCSDVDGTLVDTYELNRRAYEIAGIHFPPDAWGRPWGEWLPSALGERSAHAPLVHRTKQQAYAQLITTAEVPQLPPLEAVLRAMIMHNIPVRYLTAGSPSTARQLIRRLGAYAPLYGGMTMTARIAYLTRAARLYGSVLYIDDRAETVRQVRCEVPSVHVVHFTAQTSQTLCSAIDAWIVSGGNGED